MIVEEKVPLSALWVYDFSMQDADWNVTSDNDRAYMLEAIKGANMKIQRATIQAKKCENGNGK